MAGARALVAARHHAAARHVNLDLVCACDSARAVLEQSGEDRAFGPHRTVIEALSIHAEVEPRAAAS